MKSFDYITLRDRAELKNSAAEWFHCKWGFQRKPIWNVWRLI